MKKPNPKAAAVNAINLALRGAVKIDVVRMLIVERKHDRKMQKELMEKLHETLLDQKAMLIANKIVQDRIDSGVYQDGKYDPEADLRLEIAFAKIVVRNS